MVSRDSSLILLRCYLLNLFLVIHFVLAALGQSCFIWAQDTKYSGSCTIIIPLSRHSQIRQCVQSSARMFVRLIGWTHS